MEAPRGQTTLCSPLPVRRSACASRIASDRMVIDGLDLDAPNAAHYTTDGGQLGTDWTQVAPSIPAAAGSESVQFVADSSCAGFGISYCSSVNGERLEL